MSQYWMQVCNRGHTITDSLTGPVPADRRFCDTCGSDSITQCLGCQARIPGASSMFPGKRPQRCSSCGKPFPWTISDADKELSDLVKAAGSLVGQSTNYSVPALTINLHQRFPVLEGAQARARNDALWSFYHSLSEWYGEPRPLAPVEMKRAISQFVSFLRQVEMSLKDMQHMLGFRPDDVDLLNMYGLLRDAYNGTIERYNRLCTQAGASAVSFQRAEIYTELPKRDLVNSQTFAAGQTYDFFAAVKKLVTSATREILVVEPYVGDGDELFEVFLSKIPSGVTVRVLVDDDAKKRKPPFVAIAKKFAARPGTTIEVREVAALHDRSIFVDSRAWVAGQSLKDAASNKITYIVEMTNPVWRQMHEALWTSGKKIA